MARRKTDIDEEKKSRSVLFLLASVALLVTGIWAVWNDNISRRPWKIFQYAFRNLAYQLDHAREFNQPVEPRRARIDKLEAHRVETKKAYDDLTHQKDQLENEVKELQASVKTLEDKIADVAAERAKLEQKVDGMVVLHLGPIKMLQVPRIEQTVIEEYDRNAY